MATSQSWSPPCTAGVPGAVPPPLPAAALAGPAVAGSSGGKTPPSGARAVAKPPSSGGPAAGHRVASAGPGQSSEGPLARIRRTDLQRIGRLGVGAFGLVTLEADRRTGRTYALKAVSKGYLQHLRMQYSVLNEKRILKMLDTPFVVRLLATYNGKEYVYFLLEAALGGEMFTTYERLSLYGSEKHARFYMGCVTEALTHLHKHNVIYRDLKPENLLLDTRGYCKLTDMGLAKVTKGKTYTLVGTPDYMAPEVINQTGHTKAVDWWMLGVLLYELLSGRAPFEADSTPQVYELVKRGIAHVRFPAACRGPAKDLVQLLCSPQPEARLQTPELCEHAWFSSGRDGFDWAALRRLNLQAPYVPQVRGARDLANFRTCEGEDPPCTAYRDDGSGWDADFEDDALASRSPNTRALLGLDQAPHPPGQTLAAARQAERGQLLVLSPRQAEPRQASRQPAALAGPSITKLSRCG